MNSSSYKLLALLLGMVQSSAVVDHVNSLKGYADAAEAAKGQAKAKSDASDALLVTAQSSDGAALDSLLNEAKSFRDDATTNFDTAKNQHDLAT